ncbi:FCD domain-containing protein [Actinoplanes subtropicus]|uniref:FCD domain-containing protein n=1 Tax=Actinoplanes subtropicus TaxID=543632 RepID=UPI000A9C4A25|nr:FCD domain-containing protein [Actinoplanes subtropicus]
MLAAKGMVDARPRRGTFVRPQVAWSLLDPDVLRWQFARSQRPGLFDDLHELRAIVEPGAAGLAAARATGDDLDALDAALAGMAAAGDDASAAVAADLAFHRALLAATHNELVQRMEVVIETGLAERDRMVHGNAGTGDPVPSHKAVVEAIRRRNPAQAARAMGKLLDQAASLAAGMPHLPGVGTATEVQRAWLAGCRWMKAFPAAALGPGWISAVLGPFPGARFVATGGITVAGAPAFLAAGARVIALGAALADPAQRDQIRTLVS